MDYLPLDCEDEKTRYYFKQLFYNVNTFKDFLDLYAQFYENKICIPTYFGIFYDNFGDNPQATKTLGKKFQFITYKGVIVIDSQVTIPFKQKSYIIAYVPNDMAEPITQELNRYNNIVSFYYDFLPRQNGAEGLYVTYDDYDINQPLIHQLHFPTGKAFTQVGRLDSSPSYSFGSWLNSHMKKIINEKNFKQLTIIDADFNSSPERIVDILVDVLDYRFQVHL